MKILSVVLSASLVANFVLGLLFLFGEWRRGPDCGTSAPTVGQGSGGGSAGAPSGWAVGVPGRGASLGTAARFSTPEAMRDRLRALGVPEDCIRRTLAEHLQAAHRRRINEIHDLARNRRGRAYWQGDPVPNLRHFVLSPEQQQELLDSNRAVRTELRRLLGPAPLDPVAAYLYRRDYLDPDKGERLAALELDYSDLRQLTLGQARGFATPEDQKRLALLESEKADDLAALLTPEELAAYRLRESQAATTLRTRIAYFDASEAEYKTLFAIFDRIESRQPAMNELAFYSGASGGLSSEAMLARNEAFMKANREIEEALGPQRYAEYLKSQQRDYQALQAAAQRFDLAPAVVDRVYGLTDAAVDASQSLIQDTSLSAADRKAALARIAGETRQKVRLELGTSVGDAYLGQSMSWLSSLERGAALRRTPLGGVTPVYPQGMAPGI